VRCCFSAPISKDNKNQAANSVIRLPSGWDLCYRKTETTTLGDKKGTVFESFAEIENFRRVYIDKQDSIAWDIDPMVDSEKIVQSKLIYARMVAILIASPLKIL
jgi:hypothetical protein